MNRSALQSLRDLISTLDHPIDMRSWNTCAMGHYWHSKNAFPSNEAFISRSGLALTEAEFGITPEQARWLATTSAYTTERPAKAEVLEHIDDILYGAEITSRLAQRRKQYEADWRSLALPIATSLNRG